MALSAMQILLPKKKGKAGGQTVTPTYRPSQPTLTIPRYRDHLTDLFTGRVANDSRSLISELARHDSDVSAAFYAYQSIAGSAGWSVRAYDVNGELSTDGILLAHQILDNLTVVNDYTLGFSSKPTMRQLNDDMRYWSLLRGAPGAELIYNKRLEPESVRLIDMASIEWREKKAGEYKPVQKPTGANVEINLDIPTFFTARFHQNPSDVYTYSPFVSAINTIAARQQVINELYRITQVVGYPRMDIEVLEEVLLKSAPPLLRANPEETRRFVDTQIAKIRSAFANLSSDEALVHTDAVKVGMINDSRPATSLPIAGVIDVLNEQNQAALKTMPAVVGKSNGTGQVASTEARLFALNCDALNRINSDIWSQMLTLAVRLAGFQGSVELVFDPVELRPVLELEPQKTMKQSRLLSALSYGVITDDDFHLEMYGRPRPKAAPELMGTNFMEPAKTASVDATDQSPNGDPLGRGMAPEGGKSAKSNGVAK